MSKKINPDENIKEININCNNKFLNKWVLLLKGLIKKFAIDSINNDINKYNVVSFLFSLLSLSKYSGIKLKKFPY